MQGQVGRKTGIISRIFLQYSFLPLDVAQSYTLGLECIISGVRAHAHCYKISLT